VTGRDSAAGSTRRRRRLACRLWLALLPVWAGCTAPGGSDPRLRLDPGTVLNEWAIRDDRLDVEAARQARREVAAVREPLADALLRERIACYRRFLLNACLADVDRRERQLEARLDGIELAADQAIREAEALALNRREADALAARTADSLRDAVRREENRREYEARLQASERARRQREAEAPEIERRARENRAARERRETEAARGGIKP
jgi:hypothetical protein